MAETSLCVEKKEYEKKVYLLRTVHGLGLALVFAVCACYGIPPTQFLSTRLFFILLSSYYFLFIIIWLRSFIYIPSSTLR